MLQLCPVLVIRTFGFRVTRTFWDCTASSLKSIKTNSGKRAENGALTRSGDQVRTDKTNRTVNIVKNNKEIQTVITLQGWRTHCVCITYSGDILVVMESDAWQIPSQVVRYSGYTVKQSIQYNENGDSLFINWLY